MPFCFTLDSCELHCFLDNLKEATAIWMCAVFVSLWITFARYYFPDNTEGCNKEFCWSIAANSKCARYIVSLWITCFRIQHCFLDNIWGCNKELSDDYKNHNHSWNVLNASWQCELSEISEITADNVLNATKKRENSCKITAKLCWLCNIKA